MLCRLPPSRPPPKTKHDPYGVHYAEETLGCTTPKKLVMLRTAMHTSTCLGERRLPRVMAKRSSGRIQSSRIPVHFHPRTQLQSSPRRLPLRCRKSPRGRTLCASCTRMRTDAPVCARMRARVLPRALCALPNSLRSSDSPGVLRRSPA